MKKTFKQLTALTLTLALSASILPMSALAAQEIAVTDSEYTVSAENSVTASGACGDNLNWSLENGVLTISGTGNMDDFTIELPWRDYTDFITKVVIESGVTSIGECAFLYCTELREIVIPSTVADIGEHVFSYCDSLSNIIVDSENIALSDDDGILFNKEKTELIKYPSNREANTYNVPNGVESISEYAFNNCIGLTSVTIPDSVTYIAPYAFKSNAELSEVILPDTITSIEDFTFNECYSLNNITIPNSVTVIKNGAFYDCTGLTGIDIPNSVTEIKEFAFCGCSDLAEVTIPDSVESIGSYLFLGCGNLKKATIPNSVKKINIYVFSDCLSLEEVSIPDNMTEIPNGIFSGCTSLRGITIPDGVTRIGDFAFNGCTSLGEITIPNNVTQIGYGAFRDCGSLVNVELPDNVELIEGCAFDSCAGLKSIIVPKSMKTIENGAFDGCVSLKNVCYNGTKADWNSIKIGSENNECLTNAKVNYGHVVVVDKAVKATYSKTGLTKGSHCSGCGKIFEAQKITPKKTVERVSFTSLKKVAKGRALAKWNKVTDYTRFQVQYARNSSFKRANTLNVKGTVKNIYNLRTGKKYYVRVRAYKYENGKRYYGKWSNTKSITIK